MWPLQNKGFIIEVGGGVQNTLEDLPLFHTSGVARQAHLRTRIVFIVKAHSSWTSRDTSIYKKCGKLHRCEANTRLRQQKGYE